MVTQSLLELGVSIPMIVFLLSFCMQVMEKSMEYSNKMLGDLEEGDISALQKHINETEAYLQELEKNSTAYLISVLEKANTPQSAKIIKKLKEMQKGLN